MEQPFITFADLINWNHVDSEKLKLKKKIDDFYQKWFKKWVDKLK